MEREEWEAIQENFRILSLHVNMPEVIYFLKKRISDPPSGTQYSPLQVQQELEEVTEFQDNIFAKLLEYLRRRRDGFDLLCHVLAMTRQDFLVEKLKQSLEAIPEVDSNGYDALSIPESRVDTLCQIVEKLQTGQHYINIHGIQGVGTSCFLKQVLQYLEDSCYFTVFKIDLTDTHLILQQRHFLKIKHELLTEKRAMKKYCVFCIDNVNSAMLAQLPKYQDYQVDFVKMCIAACKKDMGISLLTTSTHPIKGLENVQLKPLNNREMGRELQRIYRTIGDSQLEHLIDIFPEQCNPLDCFLLTTLFLLHHQHLDHLRKHSKDRDHLFSAVFNKLSATQQEVLLSVYALPCNARLSVPAIFSLFSGTTRPPEDQQMDKIERELVELAELNLLTLGDDSRYSVKDSNFFYHFRSYFHRSHRKRLRVYYLRGLHYYLDYTIKFIQDVNSLHDFNESQQREWQRTIPFVSVVLDPFDRAMEEGLLRKPKLSAGVYNKRMFVIQKLRTIALDIPNQILILAAQYIEKDYENFHYKYASIEDRATLLCLITDLSLTPDCQAVDARENLNKALKEVKQLLLRTNNNETLRIKYYLRILIPLGEIYMKERNLAQAEACFKECLKLKCENKTINWMLRKRIRSIHNLLTQRLPSDPDKIVSPNPPTSATSPHFLDNDIQFHLEMGDSFYVCGKFAQAFNYYFELWRKFYSEHLFLKEQEYILMTMGHLKLQKYPRLRQPVIEAAINFYCDSQRFYKLRKKRKNEFLRICIVTATLLANKKVQAKEQFLELRNAQGHTNTQFFLSIIHKDTDHRFLWRELTLNEKEFFANRIKPAVVNYYMLEAHHYSMKLNQFRSSDMSRFIEFPSDKLLENINLFQPRLMHNQTELHLAAYIRMPTTHI